MSVTELRCSESARARQEPLHASAISNRRFLLLEVPGPWGRSALADSRLDAAIAGQLAERAERAGARVLLIRRPGRRGDAEPGLAATELAWALADVAAPVPSIHWGTWRDPGDLREVDPGAEVAPSGPQRVALVCTNGKRDQCCAIQGRSVAAALANQTSWDTWECSHVGGHRFAANVVLLPSGEMFGSLDPGLAVEVLTRFEDGEIMLPQHRGRCGQPPVVQAAVHATALRLGDSRRGALHGARWRPLPAGAGGGGTADLWEVEVTHQDHPGGEAAYRVTVTATKAEPAFMSCADVKLKAEARYDAVGFSRLR